MYLQTETFIRNPCQCKKKNVLQFIINIFTLPICEHMLYTFTYTLQVPLTESDRKISISNLSNDEDEASLLSLEI